MQFPPNTLDKAVVTMKKMAEHLVPFNFPRVPLLREEGINALKYNEITVDGYDLVVHFNKHDYQSYILETTQVFGKIFPFLPFSIVCKVAKRFLGEENLSLVEIFKEGRKIYCWTVVRDSEGKSLSGLFKAGEFCTFEDFEYNYLPPDLVKFY